MPKINASGRGIVSWGSTTACAQSDILADRNARANLLAKAARACPGGYTITEGPTITTILDCVFKWIGWWPDLITTKSSTATIQCDNSSNYPQFVFAGDKPDQEELYAAVLAWKEHYVAVEATYEELASIKTPKQMETYLKKTKYKSHLDAFLEAVNDGHVDNIVPPDLRTFLIELPFGAALAEIVQEGGIVAVDSFLRDLDMERLSAATTIQKRHGCGTVNININF